MSITTIAPIRYRPWQAGDDALLGGLGSALSQESLQTRFLTGTPTIPPMYLRYVRTVSRSRWDAVVAMHGRQLVGWAELGRNEDYGSEAELAVAVVDAWHRCGIGTTLARQVLRRSALVGVTTIVAEVLASNLASVRLVESVSGGAYAVQRAGELLQFRVPVGAAAAVA